MRRKSVCRQNEAQLSVERIVGPKQSMWLGVSSLAMLAFGWKWLLDRWLPNDGVRSSLGVEATWSFRIWLARVDPDGDRVVTQLWQRLEKALGAWRAPAEHERQRSSYCT